MHYFHVLCIRVYKMKCISGYMNTHSRTYSSVTNEPSEVWGRAGRRGGAGETHSLSPGDVVDVDAGARLDDRGTLWQVYGRGSYM